MTQGGERCLQFVEMGMGDQRADLASISGCMPEELDEYGRRRVLASK